MLKSPIRYVDELTGLRGIAAWWVVFYHFREFWAPHLPESVIMFFANGYLAVDFFFILSGFVLYISNSSSVSKLNWHEIRSFYVKRLARIYPLHLATLLAATALPLAVYVKSGQYPDASRYAPEAFFANLLLVDNWWVIKGLTWNVPSWSISAEFLSYLLFPLMVTLVILLRKNPVFLIIMAIASLIILALIMQISRATAIGDRIWEFGALRCLFQFFTGCILAHLYLGYDNIIRRYRLLIEAMVLTGIFVTVMHDIPDFWTMPIVFAALILVIAIGRPVYSFILSFRIIQIAGAISYSTYMIHFIIRDWYKIFFVKEGEVPDLWILILIFTVIFVSSYISYHLIELRLQLMIRNRLRLSPGSSAVTSR